MLSNVCPKTWWFRKDELETVSLQTLEKPQNRKNNLHVVGEKWRCHHSASQISHKPHFYQWFCVLYARRMHAFLYFLGPTYFCLFLMYKFFLVGCPKGGWLATQSTPLGSAPASSHRYERPTKQNVYVLCLTMLLCITDNAKPDLQNNNNYYFETCCSKES